MAYLKTTNVVIEETYANTIRSVQCPYCKTLLKPVLGYTTAMICWKCNREFRIQQDVAKINPASAGIKRTIIKGDIKQ